MTLFPGSSFSNIFGNATKFVNITAKGSRVANFSVGITLSEFESNLAAAKNLQWVTSADGKVRILEDGLNNIRYVSRSFSNSGPPTVEIYLYGNLQSKYRLLAP